MQVLSKPDTAAHFDRILAKEVPGGRGLRAWDALLRGDELAVLDRDPVEHVLVQEQLDRGRCHALAKGAVEGDLGEGGLENGELLVVQLREE